MTSMYVNSTINNTLGMKHTLMSKHSNRLSITVANENTCWSIFAGRLAAPYMSL